MIIQPGMCPAYRAPSQYDAPTLTLKTFPNGEYDIDIGWPTGSDVSAFYKAVNGLVNGKLNPILLASLTQFAGRTPHEADLAAVFQVGFVEDNNMSMEDEDDDSPVIPPDEFMEYNEYGY